MGRGGEVAAPSPPDDVAAARRLVPAAGGTPLEPWTADGRVLLKREDLLPTGSHKDRAARHQLGVAVERGERAVVISSSGNAAIATSSAAALARVPAFCFVHPATDGAKLAAIDGTSTTVIVTERAINGAKLVARELGIPNLRPSTSDDAVDGYESLGRELAAELPHDVGAVVLFATSGATALAVARVLAEARPGIEVHFVQGEGNAALADPAATVDDASAHAAAAGRLGVRRTRRAKQLLAAIAATGGRGHVASAADVAQRRAELAATGIDVSDETAANLAVALRLAAEAGVDGESGGHGDVADAVGAGKRARVCCVVSGAPPAAAAVRARRVEAADEHAALDVVRALLGAAGDVG